MATKTFTADLRAQLETEYRRVLDALDTIDNSFLSGHKMVGMSVNGATDRKSEQPRKTRKKRGYRGARQGTFRGRVVEQITKQWVTIEQICDATKLDKARVRGVLYAPKLKSLIERKESGDTVLYRLKEENKD